MPSATAGRAGSSNWTTSRAPGTRLATSAAKAATPSASEAVRSATAPGSAMATFIVRGNSSVAASVHGPHSWIFTGPRKPSSTCSRTSRSAESMDLARARSRPGRSASAPAVRGDLDRDVDQQRRGPASQVRSRATIGQLGKVREVGKFPDDDTHRLGRIGAGHRADPGGASGRPRVARPLIVIRHTSSLGRPGDKPRPAPLRPGQCRPRRGFLRYVRSYPLWKPSRHFPAPPLRSGLRT